MPHGGLMLYKTHSFPRRPRGERQATTPAPAPALAPEPVETMLARGRRAAGVSAWPREPSLRMSSTSDHPRHSIRHVGGPSGAADTRVWTRQHASPGASRHRSRVDRKRLWLFILLRVSRMRGRSKPPGRGVGFPPQTATGGVREARLQLRIEQEEKGFGVGMNHIGAGCQMGRDGVG